MFRSPIVITEHQKYTPPEGSDLNSFLEAKGVLLSGTPADYMGIPPYLAIDETFTASYYIGATWLVEHELPVIVIPKIPNIDYLEMFMTALSVDTEDAQSYFSKCYGIDFDSPPIESAENISQLTPLLLVHYTSLLEKLTKHGLRKDYITITENVKNKIKGRLVISQQIRKNILYQRKERNVCMYQIYTTDIPTNRLLKRALQFAQTMLIKLFPSSQRKSELQARLNKIMSVFANVSDQVDVSTVSNIRGNKLFKCYIPALKTAKEILRRYDYSLSNISEDNHQTPCFWMDMSRLFELYVYSKLHESYTDNIRFQVTGYQGTAVDFIHISERLIIDAKYKPRYENSYIGLVSDVREISGYARDLSILKNFGPDFIESDEEVKCLIVYPQNEYSDSLIDEKEGEILQNYPDMESKNESLKDKNNLWNQATPIKAFRNFRKLGIPIPLVTDKI